MAKLEMFEFIDHFFKLIEHIQEYQQISGLIKHKDYKLTYKICQIMLMPAVLWFQNPTQKKACTNQNQYLGLLG